MVVSHPLGCGKISFHAFHTLGPLQTHRKPFPDVGVLVEQVALHLRPAVLAAHLSRGVPGQASGALGRWESINQLYFTRVKKEIDNLDCIR